jgi:2-polyprenyl-3-methyl-5-hydroxy-6-metoxy-1,4-benzoquinol methylase
MGHPNQQNSNPPIDDQRRFWNKWNTEFRENSGTDEISRRRAAKIFELLRSLELSKPEIVEIGCGSGWLAEQLTMLGSVTGIDLADAVIARAQNRNTAARFMAGDFLTMNLPAGYYDVAVSISTLSHVYDQPAFIERVARILKPGGHFVLATQNRFILERTETVRAAERGQIRQWLTIGQAKRLLNAHFAVQRITTVFPSGHSGILRIVNSYKIGSASEKLISRAKLDAFKERLGLGQTIIILAKKI